MTIVFVTLAVVFLGLTVYFSPWVWRQVRMSKIRRAMVRNRMLALTFDDGPSETMTPRILDLLRQHDVKATFFLLGEHAKEHPELADRILREGHDIGCHADRHVHAWKAAPWSAIADIEAGYLSLAKWMGAQGMFRPPCGKMTLPTLLSIRRRGASVWWWTVDSGDTHDVLPMPEDIVDAVVREHGGIVLFHDLERSEERNAFVLQTTAKLIEAAKTASLRVQPLRKVLS
ncbi:MAG TPA: polysaccharide deacetylase family protein [Verrucomicrobiae bacterium]|nr:polysaccharide deacetylase family protein [Verrucomicrobiae bacterium]